MLWSMSELPHVFGAEQPRLIAQELEAASDTDLLESLLAGATGRTPAREVASRLLYEQQGNLAAVMKHGPYDEGLGPAARSRLLAAREISRRAGWRTAATRKAFLGPETAFEILREQVSPDVEELLAVYLDRKNRVIAVRRLAVGSDSFTIVDPRRVLAPALQLGAAGVVIAHNHPSGDPTPSSQDYDVTRRVQDAAELLGVTLLDHIVLTPSRYTSLAEQGAIRLQRGGRLGNW